MTNRESDPTEQARPAAVGLRTWVPPKPRAREPSRSLKQRVFRAGMWNFLLRAFSRGTGFIRNVVLARILAPDDVGLFGIALLVLSFLERFSSTGLNAALVQRKGDVGDYLDTAWTVHALRGFALAALVVATAPFSAAALGDPRAAGLIRLLGASIALTGLQNPGVIQFQRDLAFHKQFLLRSGGMLVELVVSLVLAVVLQNAWALMIGLVARRVTALGLSFVLHPYRPSVRWQAEQVAELSHFGRWIFLNNILAFLAYRGDNLVVGKLLGAPALGIYVMAFSISEVATVEVTRFVNDIAFPAFSRLQDNLKALQRGLLLSLELVLSITLPVAALLWVMAEPLTVVLLGERWLDVALLLPPLALAGSVRAMIVSGGAALKGAGYPQERFWIDVVAVAGMYAVIIPLLRNIGLPGVAWAAFAGQLLALPLFLSQVRKCLHLPTIQVLRTAGPGLILSGAVMLPLLISGDDIEVTPPIDLVLLVSYGITLAALTAAAMWKLTGSGPLAAWDVWRHSNVTVKEPRT